MLAIFVLAALLVDQQQTTTAWIPADTAKECGGVKDPKICADLLEIRDRDQLVRRKWLANREDKAVQDEFHAQKRTIDLMTKAADAGELDWGLVATTVDRIRVREGKPRVYGTQFKEVNGEYVPEPIEDEQHVGERRAKVGLQPLAEYRQLISQFYKQKPAAKKP